MRKRRDKEKVKFENDQQYWRNEQMHAKPVSDRMQILSSQCVFFFLCNIHSDNFMFFFSTIIDDRRHRRHRYSSYPRYRHCRKFDWKLPMNGFLGDTLSFTCMCIRIVIQFRRQRKVIVKVEWPARNFNMSVDCILRARFVVVAVVVTV